METVTLNTMGGFLKFYLDDLCGNDVGGKIEIQADNYFVKGRLYFKTGDIYDFYNQISKVSKSLQGSAKFYSSEDQLFFIVKVDKFGHLSIEGDYQEDPINTTKLIFELEADQTYLENWLVELKRIVNKYGDNSSEKK